MDEMDKVICFLKEIEKFKLVERTIPLSNLKRHENDAEHSWHLGMFLLLLRDSFPEDIDLEKMLKMALIHDLPEIYAGDTWAFDSSGRGEKKKREAEAAKKLFSQLPVSLENELMDLFEEYENQSSEEARIVKALDKMQPLLQNICSGGESWRRDKVTKAMAERVKAPYLDNEVVREIYDKLMKETSERNMFFNEGGL